MTQSEKVSGTTFTVPKYHAKTKYNREEQLEVLQLLRSNPQLTVAFMDTEASAGHTEKGAVIQLAMVKTKAGSWDIAEEFCEYYKPFKYDESGEAVEAFICPYAQEIHKIPMESLADKPIIADDKDNIYEFLEGVDIVITHGGENFDYPLLNNSGIDFSVHGAKLIDGSPMIRDLTDYPKRNTKDLYESLADAPYGNIGEEITEHNALWDVKMIHAYFTRILIENIQTGMNQKVLKFWRLPRNENKEGAATIRLLEVHPSQEPIHTEKNFFKLRQISVRSNRGWKNIIPVSLIGNYDPIDEWLSDIEENDPAFLRTMRQDTGARVNRRVERIANALIISDDMHPHNNGKVVFYSIPNEIWEILLKASATVNVFDYEKGANLRIKANKTESGSLSLQNTAFLEPSPIGDKDYIEEVALKTRNLRNLIAPSELLPVEEEVRIFKEHTGIDLSDKLKI